MALTIDYKEKVVLITGVSSGIGYGAVIEFAKAGANVVGCSRKPKEDASIQELIRITKSLGVEFLYVDADVTQKADLEVLVSKSIERFGKMDVVLSNAGVNVFEDAKNCSEERWQYNMDLNLASHWRLSQLCYPWLSKSDAGVILLMTSNHAFSSISGCFPYNVAKTAITGLVRSLTIEWSPQVRVVGVAPGFIQTEGNDTWFNSFPIPDVERQRTYDLHPVKRIGTVEEVGALCVYLASPLAGFISGTTILMDGGRSALMQDS